MDVDQSTLATLQDNLGIANRLARILSVELVNVEGRRTPLADPDAVDLTMRGWAILNGGPTKEEVQRSVALLEDALRIDPDNSQAKVGLAQALTLVYRPYACGVGAYSNRRQRSRRETPVPLPNSPDLANPPPRRKVGQSRGLRVRRQQD